MKYKSACFSLDDRYATRIVWRGQSKGEYQATFCDDVLGYYSTKELAQICCYNHRLEFLESLLPKITM